MRVRSTARQHTVLWFVMISRPLGQQLAGACNTYITASVTIRPLILILAQRVNQIGAETDVFAKTRDDRQGNWSAARPAGRLASPRGKIIERPRVEKLLIVVHACGIWRWLTAGWRQLVLIVPRPR